MRWRVVMVVLVTALTGACGEADDTESATATTAVPMTTTAITALTAPPVAAGPIAEDWAPSGINGVVQYAQIGVVGTVVSVTLVDGGPGGFDHHDIELAVDELLFSSIDDVGDRIRYVQLDGLRPGDSVGGLPPEVPAARRFGPVVAVGDRVITLLGEAVPDGFTETTLAPLHGYQSTWVLDGDLAVSVDPLRTVDADDLLARIAAERAGPLLNSADEVAIAADRRTVRNPLGGDPLPITTTLPPPAAPPSQVPQLITTDQVLELTATPNGPTVTARFGSTDSGGVKVAVDLDGEQIAGMGGPDIGIMIGTSTTTLLPDGRVVVSVVGTPGLDPGGVTATADDVTITELVAGTWAAQQASVTALLVAPAGSQRISVDGVLDTGPLMIELPATP